MTQEYKKQVTELNEQLQNLNNENEIERSSLLLQNRELMSQKLELEDSLATSMKQENELRSQIEKQNESIQTREMRINQLNSELEKFRNEMEETSRSHINLEEKLLMETSQQNAISQAYQQEKQRTQELESRLLMTDNCIKNIRLVVGEQIGDTELGTEVHRVIVENQSLKTSLDQVTMAVSVRDGEGEELKREVCTLRADLELADQEREELRVNLRMENERVGLERAKLERSLYTERQEYGQKLDQQRIDLERQYRVDLDNVCFLLDTYT